MPRSLPKPFKRPGIAISDGSPQRTWADTRAEDVKIGDTVADFGLVRNINTGDFGIELVNIEDVHFVLDEGDSVFAFSHRG